MTIQELFDHIVLIMGDSNYVSIELDDPRISPLITDLRKAKTRIGLVREHGLVFDFPQANDTKISIRKNVGSGQVKGESKDNDVTSFSKTINIPTQKHTHTYVVPKIASDVLDVIQDVASHVIWLTGPTQCGKDRLVHYCGRELNRKVFQINCRADMGTEVFMGSKTIVVDEGSKQNKIVFQKGLVEQAMLEGLDDNGNEVGEPGILFITEAASMPACVAIGMNRFFESDDTRRTFVIDGDGGRVVKSHSKLRIILAANTVGRGVTSMESGLYTAQTDALDISLINRIAVCFRMGYDRNVEKHILSEKIGDDSVTSLLLQYRDSIRNHIKSGKLSSPFSTAHLVHIANMYRIFGDLSKALYYVVFEFLMPEEKAIYNEQAKLILNKDLMKIYMDRDIDYM